MCISPICSGYRHEVYIIAFLYIYFSLICYILQNIYYSMHFVLHIFLISLFFNYFILLVSFNSHFSFPHSQFLDILIFASFHICFLLYTSITQSHICFLYSLITYIESVRSRLPMLLDTICLVKKFQIFQQKTFYRKLFLCFK